MAGGGRGGERRGRQGGIGGGGGGCGLSAGLVVLGVGLFFVGLVAVVSPDVLPAAAAGALLGLCRRLVVRHEFRDSVPSRCVRRRVVVDSDSRSSSYRVCDASCSVLSSGSAGSTSGLVVRYGRDGTEGNASRDVGRRQRQVDWRKETSPEGGLGGVRSALGGGGGRRETDAGLFFSSTEPGEGRMRVVQACEYSVVTVLRFLRIRGVCAGL